MKTTVYIGTSLDGFIARENGDIEWLMAYGSGEVFESYNKLMDRIDTILMGRVTFEKVCSFADWSYKMKIFVLSNTIREVPESLTGKVEVLAGTPVDALNHLRDNGYSNVYVDGGKLIQGCLAADLVDEMIISRVPLLIGSGVPLFGFLPADLKFIHRQTESFSNGLVMSSYERERTDK